MQSQPSTEITDLAGVLCSKLGDNFKVVSYSTRNLTAIGDNYGSTMLSLTVAIEDKITGSTTTLDLVAKMSPTVIMLREIFQIELTFPKECSIYTIVAPELNKFQVDRKVPSRHHLSVFCDCYGARDQVESDCEPILILENLKVQGYKIGDRRQGFDRKHAEFILTNLAQFHAVPLALRYLKPEVFANKVQPSLKKISMDKGMQPDVKHEILEVLTKNICSIPELSHLKDSIINHVNLGWKNANDVHYHRESAFNSICHNDFWMNNMMIGYNAEGDLHCIKFVDYQLTIYGSGIQDLIFFLFTSVENDVLVKHCDRLIEHYMQAFMDCLTLHGCPLENFNPESVQKEIRECAVDEFQHILLMTKVLLMKNASEITDDFMINADLIGPEYYAKLKLIVLEFEKRNWIIVE